MKKYFGLLAILTILVIHACKKEITTGPIINSSKQLSVAELKDNLGGNTTGYTVKSNSLNSANRNPNWLKAYSLNLINGSNILSVPLSQNGDDLINGTQSRLVAYKDSVGEIQKSIMVVQPDHDYLMANGGHASIKTITGKILFYSLDNIFLRGYMLNRGKITGEIKLTKANTTDKEQYSQKTQGWNEECEWRKMGYYVENGELNIYFARFCMWKYTETYIPPEQTIDFILPEPENGGYIWEVKENKTVAIKYDSLKKYFPCATNTIVSQLSNDLTFQQLIAPFQSTDPLVPNLEWNFRSDLVWGTGNRYQGGETRTYGWSSVINFNTAALENSSKLYIATITIHEAAHAYTNYLIKKLAYQQLGNIPTTTPADRDASWAMGMGYWAKLDSVAKAGAGEYIDHRLFVEKYFDTMVTILKNFDGGSRPDNEYRMLMIYGMDNAGEVPTDENGSEYKTYSVRKKDLDSLVKKIRTKYSIDSLTMVSYQYDNIVAPPNNKKVPKNCP